MLLAIKKCLIVLCLESDYISTIPWNFIGLWGASPLRTDYFTWFCLSLVGNEWDWRCSGVLCFSSILFRRSSAEMEFFEPRVDMALCKAPFNCLDSPRFCRGSNAGCWSAKAGYLLEDWVCLLKSGSELTSWWIWAWISGGGLRVERKKFLTII